GAPRDVTIRADQCGARSGQPVGRREEFCRVGEVRPDDTRIEINAGQIPGRFPRGAAPSVTPRPGQQDKRLAEEIQSREALAFSFEPQMRCARARPAQRLTWILVQGVHRVFGQDGARAVEGTELDVQLGYWRLEVPGTEVGRGTRDIARIGLLNGKPTDGPPLLVVAG